MSISRKELRLVVDTFKFYYEKVSKMENFIFKMKSVYTKNKKCVE